MARGIQILMSFDIMSSQLFSNQWSSYDQYHAESVFDSLVP